MNTTGIFQLKDGTWGYRFKICVNGKIIDRRRTRDENGNSFKNKSEAFRARKAAIYQAENTPPIREEQVVADAPVKKRIREVYEEYCAHGRKDRAYATIKKQDSLWTNHICKAFGNQFVDAISVAQITDFLTSLYYEEGFSYCYVESFLKMFYLIFGQAYSRNYLSVDVYNKLCVNKDTRIHMPKMKIDEDTDIVAFTEEECAAMEQYFHGTNAETAYLLGRYCGLRINECYGLKWSQVDLEKGTIRIEQQMQYQDGLIKLVPLKTRNARRTIYLCRRVKAYLEELAAHRKTASDTLLQQQEQKQTFIQDTDGRKLSSIELVNCLPNGKIQTVNSMKYHSRILKSEYHINFKYHYLRHTYGTRLAEMNTPAHLLCNQMGHGNIQVTQRYYISISKDGIDALKSNLEKL